MERKTHNIALLASGSGSNAEKIAHYFDKSDQIKVKLLLSNRRKAGVFDRFEKFPTVEQAYLPKEQFEDGDELIQLLEEKKIDYVILAGFLLKIPKKLVARYPAHILNIHPALLPKYGGKGMYGINVHEAVLQAQEKESGISIHLVNEAYDEGSLLFQAKCSIEGLANAQEIAAKVLLLEHQHYPKVIEDYILKLRTKQ